MKKKNCHTNHIIIDFDSTFIRVESLDILCGISQEGTSNKHDVLKKVEKLTHRGMDGEISLAESLSKRIALLHAHKSHLSTLIDALKNKVTISFKESAKFLKAYASHIYVVSNGFRDFIIPVVNDFGIKPSHVFANDFIFSDTGHIIGVDSQNLLAKNNGKSAVVKSLRLKGKIHVIGDGYTDYEIKKDGEGHFFYAFVENIHRENAVKHADYIVDNFNQFINIFKNKNS